MENSYIKLVLKIWCWKLHGFFFFNKHIVIILQVFLEKYSKNEMKCQAKKTFTWSFRQATTLLPTFTQQYFAVYGVLAMMMVKVIFQLDKKFNIFCLFLFLGHSAVLLTFLWNYWVKLSLFFPSINLLIFASLVM